MKLSLSLSDASIHARVLELMSQLAAAGHEFERLGNLFRFRWLGKLELSFPLDGSVSAAMVVASPSTTSVEVLKIGPVALREQQSFHCSGNQTCFGNAGGYLEARALGALGSLGCSLCSIRIRESMYESGARALEIFLDHDQLIAINLVYRDRRAIQTVARKRNSVSPL